MSEYFRRHIKREHYPTAPIKFKTSFRNCVYKALLGREWKETNDDDWQVMWCEKEQVEGIYQRTRIMGPMRINHFRGWQQLCRKDTLCKNVKRYKRQLQKQTLKEESSEYNFLPPTFLIPSEYVLFHEEFRRNEPRALWIMKPTAKCQGIGIFLFGRISEIARWKPPFKENVQPEPYVCQRYLLNPLLFGGRKFDMRIYALCLSYQPLTIYLYRDGFARFAHDRYDNNDLSNLYKHLTNVAINIHAPSYVKRIGGKWFLSELKKFMLSKLEVTTANNAFSDIQRVIIKALMAVQKLIPSSQHSFELYGFDFIFDSNGKAWLLEVNAGPSMTANTPEDEALKIGLIDDTMTLLNLEGILVGDETTVGGFDLIYQGKPISPEGTSIYTTYLGCKNFRDCNLLKLAKSAGQRLAREYANAQQSKEVTSKRIENKFVIKTTTKYDRPRQSKNTLLDPSKKKGQEVPQESRKPASISEVQAPVLETTQRAEIKHLSETNRIVSLSAPVATPSQPSTAVSYFPKSHQSQSLVLPEVEHSSSISRRPSRHQ